MSSLLVIPTLNEVDGMKQVIPLIKKEWVDEILIVDGGSTDLHRFLKTTTISDIWVQMP